MVHANPNKVLQLVLLVHTVITFSHAQTALLFGASGTVGSEVFNALSSNPFWDEIILVGRRFPTLTDVEDDHEGDESTTVHKPRISTIKVPNLENLDQNESLLQLQAQTVDACIITVGVGNPQDHNLSYWHSVEIEMMASMARLCNMIGVHYISVLSAITSVEDPTDFSPEELTASTGPMGWWQMMVDYERIKGLSEKAVTTASKSIPSIRIFRPSTIVTETTRYGWVDWSIFKMHVVLDPIMPSRYHSVKVKLLGMAMAGDAVELLQKRESGGDVSSLNNVAALMYDDYVRIAGNEFEVIKQSTRMDDEI